MDSRCIYEGCHMNDSTTFYMFDTTGDGRINIKFVGDVLRCLGFNPPETLVRKLLRGYKPNSSISFEDFHPILQAVKKETPSNTDIAEIEENLISGLRNLDTKMSGTIPAVELKNILTSVGDRMHPSQVDELFNSFEDDDGNVKYEELVRMVISDQICDL
ncbi:myosin-2 essential light chain-like isoform X2 [Nilaparvata lugens]|nr:myosin-2 essential light chain-like isoform X2 [Nilaparvata lugens]XP_039279581.1 myosin-2 essential light chain-like isoform X2 [Nilaparvata lugens]